MLSYAELEAFFTGLVAAAQGRGIPCAITSGMACVHYGVAATTKDCDVLCASDSAAEFLALIEETTVRGLAANYRGNLSPPLDARWLRGGWTAHLAWNAPPEEVKLDIFGIAPRASVPWPSEIEGLYVSRRVVAEMKRTDRTKDWPFITGLGIKMLKAGHAEGWLHLYDAEVIERNLSAFDLPDEIAEQRPVLTLARAHDERLKAALYAEAAFWHQLDACRIHIYERALRPYVSAVRKLSARRALSLRESHALRIECAARHLSPEPLHAHGIERLIAETREAAAKLVHPAMLEWLPDVRAHFIFPA